MKAQSPWCWYHPGMEPQNTLGCTETNQVLYSKIGIPSHLPISSQITFVCGCVRASSLWVVLLRQIPLDNKSCICETEFWGRHVVNQNHKVPYGTPPPRKHNNVYLQCIYVRIRICIPTHPPLFHVSIVSSNGWMPSKCYVCHFSQAIEAKNVAFPTNYGYPSLETIHRNARRVQVSASAVLLHLVFLKTRQMELAYFMMFTASITLSLKMYVGGGKSLRIKHTFYRCPNLLLGNDSIHFWGGNFCRKGAWRGWS